MRTTRLAHGPALAAVIGLGLAPQARAAGSEAATTEIVEVNTPAGKAPRPSLDIRINEFQYDLATYDLRFPSGLRVMFQRDTTEPIVAITAVTDHGSSDDPLGKEGIAHLVEHLWFRSEHGELPKVWDLLESEMGCSLNAFTQYDITAYMTVCASHNFPAMMKLESLRMTDPVRGVTQDMVTTEVEVVRNEIRMRSENFNIPFFTVWEYVNKHMFPEGHPYHRPIAGDHTTIRNCRIGDVQTFTEDFYTPATTTIMIVGDIPQSNFNALVDLLVRTFDLSLLHPDLKPEHIRRQPRPGIENPDPANADHWYLLPTDPDHPDQSLPIKVEFGPRAQEFAGLVPPDPVTREMGVYEGPVKYPTVAVAWTLPAGYQGDDTMVQISGSVLSNIVQAGASHPAIRSFEGCGALPSKRSTTVVCSATLEDADGNAEAVADEIIDQVALLTNPEPVPIADPVSGGVLTVDPLAYSLSRARNQFLVDILNSVDLYAAVGAGRATDIAQYAHFTGSPSYYKDKYEEVMRLQAFQIREIVDTYLKRQRASVVFIKPMERDEVAMLSADTEGSGGHYRGGGEDAILHPSIDPAVISPELVRNVISLPDTSRIDDFELPNGLRVVVMPHGEAPLVNAHLIAYGGDATDGTGYAKLASVNGFFESANDRFYGFVDFDNHDPLRLGGRWSGRLGDDTETIGIRGFFKNLDGLLWMLRERVDTQRPYLAGKGKWISGLKSGLKRNWKKTEWHISQMRSEHINPGHPLNDGIDWEDVDVLKKTSGKDVGTMLDEKWQPDNAVLLIVGKVDPAEARSLAIQYFGGWRPAKGITPHQLPPVPGPNTPQDRAIYVFDDEGKTQTEVTLACPLKPAVEQPSAGHELLGDIARMTLFARLREEAGVVYSPFAGAFTSPGGTSTMYMTAAIQNDSAVFAMERYLEFLDETAASGITETDLRIKKLSRASGYVVDQQSIDQMTSRLADTVSRQQPWSTYDTYADALANVSVSDLAAITEGCAEHAFISFYGPKDGITEQLEAAGYAFEVVDVDARYEELYEQHDPKGYKKYLKKKAKDEAKNKEGEADEAGEDEAADEDGAADESTAD